LMAMLFSFWSARNDRTFFVFADVQPAHLHPW
jgi:hypothetical protein